VLSLVNVINNKAMKARHLLLHVARETFWFKGSMQGLSVAVCKSCTLHKDNTLLCFGVKGVNVLLTKTTRFHHHTKQVVCLLFNQKTKQNRLLSTINFNFSSALLDQTLTPYQLCACSQRNTTI
jgi:aerobic-type carbon monoxide dehydrogenase small subunit (CoxS/CutS family)